MSTKRRITVSFVVAVNEEFDNTDVGDQVYNNIEALKIYLDSALDAGFEVGVEDYKE